VTKYSYHYPLTESLESRFYWDPTGCKRTLTEQDRFLDLATSGLQGSGRGDWRHRLEELTTLGRLREINLDLAIFGPERTVTDETNEAGKG
jgi:hypothetical protein